MPFKLFEDAKKITQEYGYKNVQELLLDLLRDQLYPENLERYKRIEEEMDKDPKVKTMTQAEAIEFVKGL